MDKIRVKVLNNRAAGRFWIIYVFYEGYREWKTCTNTWFSLSKEYCVWDLSKEREREREVCNMQSIYHDTNLIKRATGIHFMLLIYVWITTLFTIELSGKPYIYVQSMYTRRLWFIKIFVYFQFLFLLFSSKELPRIMEKSKQVRLIMKIYEKYCKKCY